MSVVTRVREYFASVRAEVTRVSWPSRREVLTFTVLVIVLTLALGVYLGVVDLVLQYLLRLLVTK
ncbi:MAG: preprotein translocase subunit SecE [Candidatus Bipolaricaulota bacterium]|nr:preprotein translocase subunit SecE [Candidatus Bipolaricaulota bacterium]MDW8126490.1 preprotein translocase subunit SecE [Candidatus Bipolaricaulota bacterium]